MLRVSKAEGRRAWHRAADAARLGLRNHGECVIIRSSDALAREPLTVPDSNLPGGQPPVPPEGQPGEQAHVHPAGDEDCRRSGRDQRPGGSGPSSGTRALRLHLVLIRPGTRGLPHFHDGRETAVYMVSGEAEVWHGAGLDRRTVVRAGDFIYVPPGAPHLAVNRGDVTSIAVVARADPGDEAVEVTVELPRHLAALRGVPVGGA